MNDSYVPHASPLPLPEVAAYLAPFRSLFRYRPSWASVERYVTGLLTDLGVALDARGNVAVDGDKATSVPGVFAAGDMARGQSLIVWAIQEGRAAARGVDRYLMGETLLP